MKIDPATKAARPLLLPRACALVFFCLTFAFTLSAQEGTRNFDLPAGKADRTLKQFAVQAQCQIVFAPDNVAGLETKAVHGEFTPRDALDRMVADTDLIVMQDEKSGAFAVLRKYSPKEKADAPTTKPPSAKNESADGDVVKLSPFEVRSGQDQGYVSSETTSGSRVVTKIFDVPASISVVNRDLIDDMGADDPFQALTKAIPSFTTFALPSIYNGSTIRGFRAQFWSVDGATSSSVGPTNNYNLDGMEVIKGPSALLYGPFGAYGGYVNILPKWAHANPVNKVESSLGTDEYTSNMIDLGQEWLDSKNLQTRLVAGYLHFNRPGVKGDYTHTFTFAPSLTYEISDKAKLKMRVEWNDRDYCISYVPVGTDYEPLMDKSASSFFSDAGQSDTELLTQTVLTGALSDEWSYKMQFQTQTDHYNTTSGGYTNVTYPPQDTVKIYKSQAEQYYKQWTIDMSVSWNVRDFLPGTSNQLVAGASMNRWVQEYRYANGSNTTSMYPQYNMAPWTNFSLTNPSNVDSIVLVEDGINRTIPYNVQWLGGLLLTDTLDLFKGKLKLIGGVRYNYDERYNKTSVRSTPGAAFSTTVSEAKVNTVFLHRYGAVFQPTSHVGMYVGHDEGYLAVGAIFKYVEGSALGAPLESESGENNEIGLKLDNLHALWGTFFGSLAYFELEVTNKWRADPDHSGYWLQDGVQTNNGFDAQLAYNSDNGKLNLLAGLYEADGPTTTSSGARAVYAAKRTANFWMRYNFNHHWAAGGGWKRQGNTLSGSGTYAVPAFDSIDLFVMYRHKVNGHGEMNYRLGMTNVADSKNIYYFASTGAVAVEDGRQTKLTVSYTW